MTNLNTNFSELTYNESVKVEGGYMPIFMNPAIGPLIMVMPISNSGIVSQIIQNADW